MADAFVPIQGAQGADFPQKQSVFSPDSAIGNASFRPKTRFVRLLGDGHQAILRETGRAVTPFGGLVVLMEFWLLAVVRERLPFCYRSPNAIGAANRKSRRRTTHFALRKPHRLTLNRGIRV